MAGRTRPHTQIGQKGKGKNRPHRGAGNGPGGGGGQSSFGPSPGVGGMPQYPQAPPAFLPQTPGFESTSRQANDQLTGAEGQYAMGQIMTPAQLGMQKQRLTTDMGLDTDRLKEQLAGRGVFTAKNAQGTYGGTSPAGGGIGQTMYTRNVANPYGRQFQDLASQGASQYGEMASGMAGAQLGYNQNMFEGLLGAGQEAMQAQPLSLPIGGYNLPHMTNPSFSNRPGGRPNGGRPGRTQPRHNRNNRNNRGGR